MTLPALLAVLGCTRSTTPTDGLTSAHTAETGPTTVAHSTADTGSSATADTGAPSSGTTADTGAEPELQCRKATQEYFYQTNIYPTEHVSYVYDGRGNLVSLLSDYGPVLDGIIDRRQDGSYDSGDRVTSWCLDAAPADGVYETCDTFGYDPDGHLVHLEYRAAGSGISELALGVYDYVWDAGQCASRTGPSGGWSYNMYWTWDGAGRMLTESLDSNPFGVMDWIDTYTYDTNGWLTLYQHDNLTNRTSDLYESFERDAAGNVLHWRFWRWGGSDFVCTEDTEYTYDAQGHILTQNTTDCLGFFQFGDTIFFTYDAAGNRTSALSSSQSGWRWTWDADHNLLSEEDLLDGRLQTTYRWTYECFPAGTFPAPSVPGGGPCDPPIPGYRRIPGSEVIGP